MLKPHRLAEMFPSLGAEAYQAMKADILEHGLREPILLCHGQILDGRNRYLSLYELWRDERPLGPGWGELAGKPLPVRALNPLTAGSGLYVWYQGTDLLDLVISLNLHRRHLDESQRAMIAARLSASIPAKKGRKAAATNAPNGVHSTAEASLQLNVGVRTVVRARAVLLGGTKELVAAVDNGKLPVSEAAKALAMAPAEQTRIAGLAEAGQARGVRVTLKQGRRAAIEASLGRRQEGLPSGQFGVILADPPWRFETRSSFGMDRSAENHYPTMTTNDICGLPVAAIAADHAIGLVWATAAMLPDAMDVLDDWGFVYRSHIVWDKGAVNGLGYWLRNRHELLLIGTRGRPPAPAEGTQWPSLIQATKGAHSTKPAFGHAFAETFWPSLPKVELFARAPRLGWSVWGNQAKEQVL
jgi:N6-adenosine-specific RNA methylase IME4